MLVHPCVCVCGGCGRLDLLDSLPANRSNAAEIIQNHLSEYTRGVLLCVL
jgi:hypothetical protein